MSSLRNLLHTECIVVRWGDMDSVGHVNNAVYFTYMESARVGWLRQLAIEVGLGDRRQGPVTANAFCSYRRAVVYPATLQIKLWGGPAGNTSFETSYEIRDDADQAAFYCEGSARLVWVDYGSGRPIPLPTAVRNLLPSAEG